MCGPQKISHLPLRGNRQSIGLVLSHGPDFGLGDYGNNAPIGSESQPGPFSKQRKKGTQAASKSKPRGKGRNDHVDDDELETSDTLTHSNARGRGAMLVSNSDSEQQRGGSQGRFSALKQIQCACKLRCPYRCLHWKDSFSGVHAAVVEASEKRANKLCAELMPFTSRLRGPSSLAAVPRRPRHVRA